MREAKTVVSGGNTTTTSSLWAGVQLVAERDSDGTLYRYLCGPGGAPLELSVTASGGLARSYAYQLDHAGSVIGLTSAAGTVVASYAYDPWGNPTSIGGSNAALANRQPLRYRGYYWDAETALYYMPARFYDPAVGRFLSMDPAAPSAGNPASLNRYTYCEDDPVNSSDSDGREPHGYNMADGYDSPRDEPGNGYNYGRDIHHSTVKAAKKYAAILAARRAANETHARESQARFQAMYDEARAKGAYEASYAGLQAAHEARAAYAKGGYTNICFNGYFVTLGAYAPRTGGEGHPYAGWNLGKGYPASVTVTQYNGPVTHGWNTQIGP